MIKEFIERIKSSKFITIKYNAERINENKEFEVYDSVLYLQDDQGTIKIELNGWTIIPKEILEHFKHKIELVFKS